MSSTSQAASAAFYRQLGRLYGTYTGLFAGFIILVYLLELLKVPNRILGYLFVFFTLAVYAIIGVATRTAEVSEYYVAGRRVPAFYNGMATGADWMSAASFVGMAGSLFLQGYDGIAWVLGWTGGFVLVSILIGPYLRKFGAYTVPDFLAFRYGGNFARFIGVIVLVCASFTYVTAQVYGTGLIASRFIGIPFSIAVFVGLAGILLCSMLGGMRAVTWTQIAQYIVLIIAYLTPIVILSIKKYGVPIPELTYGQAIADITARELAMVKDGLAVACTEASCPATALKSHVEPFTTWSPINYFGIILCMMVGTASLPHILMRYFTTPSVREARQSVAWSLLFIFLLYFSAPAYAAFSKLEVYTNLIGLPMQKIPEWVFQYGSIEHPFNPVRGLIDICGKAAKSLEVVLANCGPSHGGILRFQDFVIDTDVIVLSTPEIAGLPYVVSGLVAAGGLAAALSTADGLLLAIANALSHDVYYKMITPLKSALRYVVVGIISVAIVGIVAVFLTGGSPIPVQWASSLGVIPERWLEMNALPWNWLLLGTLVVVLLIVIPFWIGSSESAKRLIVARVLLLFVAIAAAGTASTRPGDILAMVGWAFSLAMAGNFPALVMGIWWKRTTTTAAIWGMIAGFGLCVFYLVCTRYFPGWGVQYFGMTALPNAATGLPGVDLVKAMAVVDPTSKDFAMGTWVAGSHALAGKVGWFGLNNINCGMLGAPLGFLVIYVVSLFTKPPSVEMMAFVDEIRKPRGQTVLEEKTN